MCTVGVRSDKTVEDSDALADAAPPTRVRAAVVRCYLIDGCPVARALVRCVSL